MHLQYSMDNPSGENSTDALGDAFLAGAAVNTSQYVVEGNVIECHF